MKDGRNQKYLRKKNTERILRLLRHNDMTYSELARALSLSNTAISNIVNDLIEEGMVERNSDSLGRGGIKIRIRKKLGYVVVIDFSKERTTVTMADLSGGIIYEERTQFEFKISKSTFDKVFEIMDSFISNRKKEGEELCCISIATPGKIDKKTGYFILAPRFHEYTEINLKKMFTDKYGVEVIVNNDINLAMLGFSVSTNEEFNNAVMIHCGVGLGGAFMVDGKLYEGSHGFAGEMGICYMDILGGNKDPLATYDEDNYVDYGLSMLSIIRSVQKGLNYGRKCSVNVDSDGNISIESVIKAYNDGDELVVEIVNNQGRALARFVQNIVYIFDVDCVVFNGGIVRFDRNYWEIIKEGISKDVKVLVPNADEDLILIGGIEAGSNDVFKKRFLVM